jgi:anti-sigma factor RsiW
VETAFAAQLIKDHQKCFVALGSSAEALEAAEAEARLAQRYGWRMRVPESSRAARLTLVDVRRCVYADGAVAHILYELADRPVSLFIVPDARQADRVLEIMGHDALIWSGNGNAYVLVGDQGTAEMTRLATYVRRFTN